MKVLSEIKNKVFNKYFTNQDFLEMTEKYWKERKKGMIG
jgi:hypothetical protein